MKVLLIEDDALWAQGLITYLNVIEGWEVVFAQTPTNALSELEKAWSSIDLILLDIMMAPDEVANAGEDDMGQSTGLVLLDKIETVTGSAIPVVLLTARQDLLESDYKGKAQLYLQKTLTTGEIIEAIKGICDAH